MYESKSASGCRLFNARSGGAIIYYLLKSLPTQPQPNPSYTLASRWDLFLKTPKIASAMAMAMGTFAAM